MKLTPAQQAYIAQRAQWYFDVAQFPYPNKTSGALDTVVFTGDGLDDLNRTISFVNQNPNCQITAEVGVGGNPTIQVGLGNAFPKYERIDIQDIYAIKDAYIAFYGSVSKPPYVDFSSAANRIS